MLWKLQELKIIKRFSKQFRREDRNNRINLTIKIIKTGFQEERTIMIMAKNFIVINRNLIEIEI